MQKVMVKTAIIGEDSINGYEVIVEAEDGEYATVVQMPDDIGIRLDEMSPEGKISGRGNVLVPSAFHLCQAVALEIARVNAGIYVSITH